MFEVGGSSILLSITLKLEPVGALIWHIHAIVFPISITMVVVLQEAWKSEVQSHSVDIYMHVHYCYAFYTHCSEDYTEYN